MINTLPIPQKIALYIQQLSPKILKKTSFMLKNIMEFDFIDHTIYNHKLVTPQPEVILDRKKLDKSHSFSDIEIDILFDVFCKQRKAYDGTISKNSFWNILGKACPLLQKPSLFRSKLFTIFHDSSTESGVTIYEFILAVSVLSNRSTIMSKYQLAYEIVFKNKILDLSIFSDLPTVDDTDVLFRVEYPSGKTDITRSMFIGYWTKLFESNINRDEFEKILNISNSSRAVLFFPFWFSLPIESAFEN